MAGDLGSAREQVHRAAAAVLGFWFDELTPAQWFARDDALDARIADRFGAGREAVLAGQAAGWREDADTLLAAVILLDQFGRNIDRGRAAAYAGDGLARALADLAIAKGWDMALAPVRRQFLYMPFMHGEAMADQDRSVALFTSLGLEVQHDYALRHRDVIARFGRFPGRNAALGRETTAAERAALANGADF